MSTMLVVALALGQILAMILALNTSHGLGANVRWMDRAVLAVIFTFGLVGGGIVWNVWGLAWWNWPLAIRVYSVPCIGLVLLGLPAVTVLRALRRPAMGATLVRSEIRDLRRGNETSELIGTGIRARILGLPFNDALKIRTTHWSVKVAGLPPALDGLSILHLTDLHLAPAYGRRFFEKAIDIALASGTEPDLVAITGDFIDDDAAIAWIDPILGRLRGRFGQFAILGNHDYRHDFRGLRRALRLAGFKTLEGRWTTLEIAGARLAIGGTTAPWGKDLAKRPVPPADAYLLLSHSPDQVYRADGLGIDLMLCGHNHGGQVRLPIVGPVLMPSQYSRRFDRGFFRVGRTMMFVGQGLGAKDPLRIGCPPEIARITLGVVDSLDASAGTTDKEVLASYPVDALGL
jgi:uncharacterized protein